MKKGSIYSFETVRLQSSEGVALNSLAGMRLNRSSAKRLTIDFIAICEKVESNHNGVAVLDKHVYSPEVWRSAIFSKHGYFNAFKTQLRKQELWKALRSLSSAVHAISSHSNIQDKVTLCMQDPQINTSNSSILYDQCTLLEQRALCSIVPQILSMFQRCLMKLMRQIQQIFLDR